MVEINGVSPLFPSLLLGSCDPNLLFEIPTAFPWHHASHRESTELSAHETSTEKSKQKVHFPSCLECLSEGEYALGRASHLLL